MAEPDVAVLRDETVRPAGEGRGVQLEQGGEVVTVGDGDQVVDGLGRVRTCRRNRINQLGTILADDLFGSYISCLGDLACLPMSIWKSQVFGPES